MEDDGETFVGNNNRGVNRVNLHAFDGLPIPSPSDKITARFKDIIIEGPIIQVSINETHNFRGSFEYIQLMVQTYTTIVPVFILKKEFTPYKLVRIEGNPGSHRSKWILNNQDKPYSSWISHV